MGECPTGGLRAEEANGALSGNTRAFWSLERARHVLGYAPRDDSEVGYATDVRRLLTGPPARARGGRPGA